MPTVYKAYQQDNKCQHKQVKLKYCDNEESILVIFAMIFSFFFWGGGGGGGGVKHNHHFTEMHITPFKQYYDNDFQWFIMHEDLLAQIKKCVSGNGSENFN